MADLAVTTKNFESAAFEFFSLLRCGMELAAKTRVVPEMLILGNRFEMVLRALAMIPTGVVPHALHGNIKLWGDFSGLTVATTIDHEEAQDSADAGEVGSTIRDTRTAE